MAAPWLGLADLGGWATAAAAGLVCFGLLGGVALARWLRRFRPTKVRVRVVGHKAQGAHHALLCEVLEPDGLHGRYHLAATARGDLVAGADGAEFEVWLNFTMVGALAGRPLDYFVSAPAEKCDDFLEMARRVK